MQILNTKLLICVLAGLVAIAATLAEIRKTQTEHNAAAVPQQMMILPNDDIEKHNKAFEEAYRRDVKKRDATPANTAKAFSTRIP